jgi:hypothetical protein
MQTEPLGRNVCQTCFNIGANIRNNITNIKLEAYKYARRIHVDLCSPLHYFKKIMYKKHFIWKYHKSKHYVINQRYTVARGKAPSIHYRDITRSLT